MVGCGSNSEGAYVVDRYARVDGNAKPADARVDGQARAARWSEQVDLGIECPPSALAACTPMDCGVSTALGKDRRESFGNGCQSIRNVSKGPILGQSFLLPGRMKIDGGLPLRRRHPVQLFAHTPNEVERSASMRALSRSTARAARVPYQKRSFPSTSSTRMGRGAARAMSSSTSSGPNA